MASNFDQFLKASWNTIFSAKEAPRRENAADRRRRWSRPGLSGGDLGGGKPDVQTPRRVAVRNLALEGSGRFEEDLEPMISHAVPGWAAD